jgi:hypothetical protein
MRPIMTPKTTARLRAVCALFAAAAFCFPVSSAAAADFFRGWPVVPDPELDDLRGGFLVADGVAFYLGAVVRTTVNGELVLETVVNWTPQGPLITQSAAPGLSPATVADLKEAAARTGLDLSSLSGGSDVILLNDGATAVAHRFDIAGLENILVNEANGQDIRQDTAVTLHLPEGEAVTRAFVQDLAAFRMLDDVQGALSGH